MGGNRNSGGRPKSTALKILTGNPGKRPLNAREPKPDPVGVDFDVPPLELVGDPIASAEWTRLAPALRLCGMLTTADRALLISACEAWSEYRRAKDEARRTGLLIRKGPANIPSANPYLHIQNGALLICLRLWQELGLTPSSRARLVAVPLNDPPSVSKWEGLL